MPSAVTSLVYTQRGDVISGDSDGGLVMWRRDENDTYMMTDDWLVGLKNAHKVKTIAKHIHARSVILQTCLVNTPVTCIFAQRGTGIRSHVMQGRVHALVLQDDMLLSFGGSMIRMWDTSEHLKLLTQAQVHQ